MIEQSIYEQYYQAWIKKHLRKILLTAFIIITMGIIFETHNHIQQKYQKQAQSLFESYLDQPSATKASYLMAEYPNYIQTHLVLFSEAKNAYTDNHINDAIAALDFIRTHSSDKGIIKISTYRLAHIYLEQKNTDKAHTILSSLDEDGYTQLQLALSISDPDERMEALNKALLLSDSAYLSNMISIAQNDLI